MWTWRSIARRLGRAFQRDGVRGVARLGVRRARLALTEARPARVRRRLRERRFDTDYGVETRGYVSIGGEGEGELFEHGHPYQGSPHSTVQEILGRLPIDRGKYLFADLGCGKGRAMFVAAELGFARVVGVELSDALIKTARRNLQCYRETVRIGPEIEVEQADATIWRIPDEPTVLYLFNPFGGPLIVRFARHLERTVAQRRAPLIVVLYDSDPFYPRFDASDAFERLAAHEDHRVYRALTQG